MAAAEAASANGNMQIQQPQQQPKEIYPMKASTKKNAHGRMHQAKGTIKEVAGKIVGNRDLETRGKLENMAGDLEVKLGRAEKNLKN